MSVIINQGILVTTFSVITYIPHLGYDRIYKKYKDMSLLLLSIVYFKRLDSRQNELKMYVISIWSRFE